jgi:hypothetical protein
MVTSISKQGGTSRLIANTGSRPAADSRQSTSSPKSTALSQTRRPNHSGELMSRNTSPVPTNNQNDHPDSNPFPSNNISTRHRRVPVPPFQSDRIPVPDFQSIYEQAVPNSSSLKQAGVAPNPSSLKQSGVSVSPLEHGDSPVNYSRASSRGSEMMSSLSVDDSSVEDSRPSSIGTQSSSQAATIQTNFLHPYAAAPSPTQFIANESSVSPVNANIIANQQELIEEPYIPSPSGSMVANSPDGVNNLWFTPSTPPPDNHVDAPGFGTGDNPF